MYGVIFCPPLLRLRSVPWELPTCTAPEVLLELRTLRFHSAFPAGQEGTERESKEGKEREGTGGERREGTEREGTQRVGTQREGT